ncbi:unnamed protein product, partial [marine sediment metagenome]
MSKIKNIHDKFCKHVFSNKQNISIFLDFAIPIKIKKFIDLNKIEIDPSNYIERKWKERFSDLVVKTKTKTNNIDIYILFEHKSMPDNKIFIQLLRYMYLMWENDSENN